MAVVDVSVLDGHGTYPLTGPEALTLRDVAARASAALGRAFTFDDISAREYRRELADLDLDPWWAYAYASMFDSVRDHRWAAVTDDLERLIGRRPHRLDEVITA